MEKQIKANMYIHKEIDWDISTNLNRWVASRIDLFLETLMVKNQWITSNKYIDSAINSCEMIIDAGYDIVKNVFQIYTAHTSLAFCLCLCDAPMEKVMKNIDEAQKGYVDVSSLDGVAKCMYTRSVALLIYGCRTNNADCIKNSYYILREAYSFTDKCKIIHYKNRIIKMIPMYIMAMVHFLSCKCKK